MDDVNLIKSLISSIPYYGMVGFAIIASLFPGIPEEVFLLVVGYMVGTGDVPVVSTILFLIAGFLIMDSALFYLSRRGAKVMIWFRNRLLGSDFDHQSDFLKKHISWVIFISRFALYVRWIGPILAGGVKTKWKDFLLVDFVALSVYVPTMIFFGAYFRNRIEKIVAGVNLAGNIIIAVILVFLVVSAVLWFRRRFMKKIIAWSKGENGFYNLLGISFKKK